MAESQEEKIKKIFADKNIKIKDILDKMFPQGKGSYYNEVRKPKLSPSFIDGIKKHFEVDLVKELSEYEQEEGEYSKEYLIKENIRLHRKLESLLEEALKEERKVGSEKDLLIELQKEIARLKDQLNKKSA